MFVRFAVVCELPMGLCKLLIVRHVMQRFGMKQMALHKIHAWVYLTYITVACAVTSGLNIAHTKYFLGVEPRAQLFIAPIIAGVVFGYITARQRIAHHILLDPKESFIFAKYIIFSCAITSSLNIVHTEWILHRRLSGYCGSFFRLPAGPH